MTGGAFIFHLLACTLLVASVVAATREETPAAVLKDGARLAGIILACVAGLAAVLMLFEV